MHGDGTFIFADGKKYKGQFHYGKRQGKGKMIWTDGKVYDGEWYDDKMHGNGKQSSRIVNTNDSCL